MPDIDKSYQELIITNFGLSPSGYTGSIGAVGATGPAGGYTGSRGDAGYVGSAGPGMSMTTDTFTGDGTTTAFVLTTTPDSINRTIVNYNGVTVLRSAYTLSTATITFSSAPAVGSQIEITTINSASGSGGATGTALKITTVGYVGNNTATDTAGGETVTLTGTGFVTGASVIVNGVAAGVVTVVSATQLTFTAPALAAGTYIFYVVNTDGATAISVPGISYSGVPSFYVGAGSVGSVYEASSFNSNVAAVGDSAITYTIASGSLPAGATLNANGVITGSSVLTASPTTYTFGVTASDGQNQDVTRSYTITVNPDAVTWSAPTDAATVTLGQNSYTSTTLTAVSAAGKAVTYTANALPTGLSIVGGEVTGTPTVLGNTTTVLTATATSTTRSANITVTWNVAVTNEPYFMYNSLLLSGNGSNNANNNTFLDSSTNNFAITRNGNTAQGSFSPYGTNWSNYLGGAGNYFQTPASSASTIVGTLSNTANLTIECWIYPTAYNSSANFPGLIGDMVATSENNNWSWGITNTGTLMIYWNSGAQFRATSSNAVSLNTWTHIALNVAAGAITMYINGVSQSLSGTTTLGTPGSNGYLVIGQWNNGSGGTNGTSHGLYTGYISNLRVVKASTYTSSFTPLTTPLTAIANTSLLYCQSNRFKDNSTNNLAITVGGTPTVQRFSPFLSSAAYSASTTGGSVYIDGTGDYLSLPNNAVYSFGTGDFTVECWAYVTQQTANQYYGLFGKRPLTSSQGWFSVNIRNNVAILAFASSQSGGWGSLTNGNLNVPLNAWTHIAVSRSGSSLRLFVNGVIDTAASITTSATVVDTTSPFFIGTGTSDAGGEFFQGYISNFRIVKGTAVYTSAFVPPTAPVTAIANTVLLADFTNAGIIDSTMQNNIETVGDAKISTTQSKFGSSSMYFDGTGDAVVIPASTVLAPLTGDFTYECWVYPTSSSITYRAIFGIDNYSGTQPFRLYQYGTNFQYWYTGGASNFIGSSTITVNTWYHIAVTRSAGVIRMFVNGTQTGSNVTSTLNYPPSIFRIGLDLAESYPFIGYIDDLRITRGYARYTANFTAPVSAFSQK